MFRYRFVLLMFLSIHLLANGICIGSSLELSDEGDQPNVSKKSPLILANEDEIGLLPLFTVKGMGGIGNVDIRNELPLLSVLKDLPIQDKDGPTGRQLGISLNLEDVKREILSGREDVREFPDFNGLQIVPLKLFLLLKDSTIVREFDLGTNDGQISWKEMLANMKNTGSEGPLSCGVSVAFLKIDIL